MERAFGFAMHLRHIIAATCSSSRVSGFCPGIAALSVDHED